MKHKVAVTVNGRKHEHEVEPRLLLVHYLRDVVGTLDLEKAPSSS